jgi:hypothetical protein
MLPANTKTKEVLNEKQASLQDVIRNQVHKARRRAQGQGA